MVSHSKRKERVLNGTQFIGGEPRVRRLDRATCLSGKTQQLGNDFRFPINPTDSPAQVDRMINQYLALPEDQGGNYSVTPQNPGGTLVQPK